MILTLETPGHRRDKKIALAAISTPSLRSERTSARVGVRSRAPLRLGLAGGGTDLSPYCDEHGGAVLNATIGRYAYAHLTFRDDHRVVFRAHDVNKEDILPLASELPTHEGLILHRAVFNRIARDYMKGRLAAITVTTTVEAPAGSGLGSSSALVVALVEAYRQAFDLPLGRYDVARLAFEIERIDLGLAGGRQDQYAASFGGINFMEFLPNDKVIVNPLRVERAYLNELEASLVTCFTGRSRESDTIIREQVKGIASASDKTVDAMHELKADAIEMKQALLYGNIAGIAEVLNRSWQSKKRTAAAVSNEHIEAVWSLGMANGAIAGKVSGAGGGGFLMFICDPEQRYRLISALNASGAEATTVQFTSEGAEAWATGL